MKNLKSHFKFNKQERSGIFFLLLLIILFQVGYFAYRTLSMEPSGSSFLLDDKTQAKIDVLKEKAQRKDSVEMYPFNPNFITDYKGYVLGMSVVEIDRLHSFRAKEKFINSAEEFQEVTQISDSLLNAIARYFKFPEWTKKKETPRSFNTKKNKAGNLIKDINLASAEDLQVISGIGEKLSARIVKFRNRLGGFLIEDQLYDVYGLDKEVANRAKEQFKVLNPPQIEKININTASTEMMTKLIYLQEKTAKSIINYRNVNGTIKSFDELLNIENFPKEKIDRIALYLAL